MPSRRIAFEKFADFEPRHSWQHKIQNYEVGLLGARFRQAALAVTGGQNAEAARFTQVQQKKIDNVFLIFDHQDSLASFHKRRAYIATFPNRFIDWVARKV